MLITIGTMYNPLESEDSVKIALAWILLSFIIIIILIAIGTMYNPLQLLGPSLSLIISCFYIISL